MSAKNPAITITDLANEVRLISHNMRSALSVLKVGAQLAQRDPNDIVEIAPSMTIKVNEIDGHCDRLKEIAELLKG